MTAKEKAKELRVRFFILPHEHAQVAKMTLEQAGKLSKLIVQLHVDIMIKDRERRPATFWKDVKKEIELM